MTQISDSQSIQSQLSDVNKLLMRVMAHAARMNEGQTSQILRDLTQMSANIGQLKQNITGYLDSQQRQVGALIGVGSAINSSLGLKRVLELVLDPLIALMNAERGFLMLREPNGELKVRIARGIDNVNLNEEVFAISNTVVRRVVES